MYNPFARFHRLFTELSFAKKILFLGLWSTAFVIPLFLSIGTNIVTRTFYEGSERFWAGLDPYLAPGPGTDVYHYPPFFAFLYYPFLFLSPKVHAILWAFVNALFFWAGIVSFSDIAQWKKKWFWVGVVLAAMELDISLRYQQSNALVIGLTLLGVGALRDKKEWSAGLFLAMGSFIKIFPGFIALYFFPWNRKFAVRFTLCCLGLFVLPAFFVGFSHYIELMISMVRALTEDTLEGHSRRMLDVRTLVSFWGYTRVGDLLSGVIGLGTVLGLALLYRTRGSSFPWAKFAAFFLAGFIAVSIRTESPTFVCLAAFYPFLLLEADSVLQKRLLFISFSLITVLYTSVWPRFFYTALQDHWASKTIGIFFVWCILFVSLVPRLSVRKVGITTT